MQIIPSSHVMPQWLPARDADTENHEKYAKV